MTIEDEVRRATKLLETVMQAAGLTRKDLDQRLGAGPGYISQVLTGRMELKFRHILAILRALDVDPGIFFQTLYPESRPASDQAVMEEFLRRFKSLGFGSGGTGSGGGAGPPPSPAPPLSPPIPMPSAQPAVDVEELERLVRKAVREALTEGEPQGDDKPRRNRSSG